jgi:LmbE family N-acetylglucosaminyl deacetylase
MLAALLTLSAPSLRGANSACPAGASMQIVAHPDDDLLFQSPDVLHDVQAGRCVRTVFVTAGERGDPDLMDTREAGIKAAYANMAGVSSTWTTADAGISGHPMPLATLVGKPTVSLVFMRLPEGFWGDGGTPQTEMIKNLWQGSISQMRTDDGSSTYTKTSLTATLTALMTAFQPDTIRTQDYVGTFGDGDHDDHHAASYFARQAHLAYTTSHTFVGYQDYETENRAQNVFGSDLTAKTNAFNAYLQFDEAPCGSPPNCGNNEYSLWLKRQYVKGTESGTDTTPPVVASVTPANGAANVSLGTSVSATFSESISAASVTGTSFAIRDGSGTLVPATVSSSGPTATLQPSSSLQPSTTYTATLLSGSSGIKDLAGNALASTFTWTFTTVAPDTTPPTVTAVTPAAGTANVSLGTSISATFSEPIAAASVTGTSFTLRDGGGNAVPTTLSASGATATLQPSTSLQPSTTYTATLLSGSSGVKDTSGNPLATDFTWSFTTTAPDLTPPTVAGVTPADGATNVSAGTSVSATFSEPVAAASVNTGTFVLRNGGGGTIAATVSSSGSTATLQPTFALAPSTTYTATLVSGSAGIKDLAGNPLAADSTWTFTTAAGPSCPCSLFAANAVPLVPADTDTTPYELGVRFKSDVSGYITGIRFYKGSGNTGTHVGHLWTSTGTQLAAATFTGETTTGWQRVSFATPVAVSANTVYVASYTDPAGRHALDRPFFTTQYNNAPLRAPADGDGGGNGVYTEGSGFPNQSSQASNYWVDVSFVTTLADTTPPTVASVTPASGAGNVSLGAAVSATFSEPVMAASVTGTTFVLRDGGGNTVPATVSASGATVSLQPTAALQPSTTYTATLLSGPSGVKDLAGNALAADFSWSFTTLVPDTTPPTVVSVTPSSGASNVSIGTSVSATFSETVSAASVNAASFVLRDSGGNAVPATVSSSGSSATLQPSAALQLGATYTATLLSGQNGVKDLAGNALASDFTWSFTTVPPDTTPPTVAAVTPAAGAGNVSLGTSLSATFSEPISAASVTGTSFSLRDGNGVVVASTVSASGSTATLRPGANLQPATTYTATLLSGPGGIQDMAGNPLATDFTWSFTTAVVDLTPPVVTAAFPASSSYNAARWNAGCATNGICGTASDSGTGVQKVEISLRRLSNNRYWNGTGFNSTTELWFSATGTTSWAYTFAASSFPGAGSYTLRVRATDNSSNVATPVSTTFIYDNTNPTSAVTFPVANASYTSATWNVGCATAGVCGTASDASSGVQGVDVSIRRGAGNYWNGTSFSSTTEIFFPAAGTTSWTFAFPASNFPNAASYRIRVRARDNAGNVQSPTTRTISFTP